MFQDYQGSSGDSQLPASHSYKGAFVPMDPVVGTSRAGGLVFVVGRTALSRASGRRFLPAHGMEQPSSHCDSTNKCIAQAYTSIQRFPRARGDGYYHKFRGTLHDRTALGLPSDVIAIGSRLLLSRPSRLCSRTT